MVGRGDVVVITGGLSGIGAATAVAFGKLGATVVMWDRSVDGADATIEAVRAAGGQATAEQADVRDAAALEALATSVVERFGRLDVLVASAGVADQSTVAAGDPVRWRTVVETNLLGLMYTARAVVPHMTRVRHGHVVIVASLSGRETYVGEPAYIASKWGAVGFGHALRQEVMDDDVRVTLVEPGIVDSPLTRGNPAVLPVLEGCTPLRCEDVAGAIVYACQQPAYAAVTEIALRPQRQGSPDIDVPDAAQ